jgi:hypothetical protein
MATTPNYANGPRCGIAQATTANTNRDGTGTLAIVFTAGSNGSRIDKIESVATGSTTAGMLRYFIHDGTNARMEHEKPVQAVTPSGTVPSWKSVMQQNGEDPQLFPILLPAGFSLRVSTHNAETFNIIATGGDF